MITALCIDKKGFTKSFTIPEVLPEVRVPLSASATILGWYDTYNPPEYNYLTFRRTDKMTRLDGHLFIVYQEN